MESGQRIEESKWHRPHLYLTILAIYLLVPVAICIFGSSYFWYTQALACESDYYHCANTPASLPGLQLLLLPANVIGLVVLGIPSVFGSVNLLRGKKKGKYFSLVALILFNLISLFLILVGINQMEHKDFLKYLTMNPLFISWFASNCTMLGFLAKGWTIKLTN